MRKGVAVPYIIALILGIVVIGLLGYWFFVLGGQTGTSATQQGCNTKQASWCQLWSINNFNSNSNGGCPPGLDCSKGPDAAWQAFAPGCVTSAPGPTFCQAAFGGGTASSSSTTTTTNLLGTGAKCTADTQCQNGKCLPPAGASAPSASSPGTCN